MIFSILDILTGARCIRRPVPKQTVRSGGMLSQKKACLDTYGRINLQETPPAPTYDDPVGNCCQVHLILGCRPYHGSELFNLGSFSASAPRGARPKQPLTVFCLSGFASSGYFVKTKLYNMRSFPTDFFHAV